MCSPMPEPAISRDQWVFFSDEGEPLPMPGVVVQIEFLLPEIVGQAIRFRPLGELLQVDAKNDGKVLQSG